MLTTPALVGSLEMLGNPTRLIRSIGKVRHHESLCSALVRLAPHEGRPTDPTSLSHVCVLVQGVRDLFVLPVAALRQRQAPIQVLRAAASGWGSFFHHVSEGALTSVSGFATSLSRNLDRLSLDSECVRFTRAATTRSDVCACVCAHGCVCQHSYVLQREAARAASDAVRGSGVTRHLATGVQQLSSSVLGAATGIVTAPITATASEGWGVGSLLRGVGKGVLGALTKPVSGAVDLVGHTSQGILNSAGLSRGRRQTRSVAALTPLFDTELRIRYKLLPRLRHALRARARRSGGANELDGGGVYYLCHAPCLCVRPSADGSLGQGREALLVLCWQCIVVFSRKDAVVLVVPTSDVLGFHARTSHRGLLSLSVRQRRTRSDSATVGVGTSPPSPDTDGSQQRGTSMRHFVVSPQDKQLVEQWLVVLIESKQRGHC